MKEVQKGILPSHLSNNVSIEILVNGRPVKQYKHNKKLYIEGRKDSEYSIKITNKNNSSVYAIVSVDGLSVVDGTQASENSVGFLIGKNSSFTVPGWLMDQKTAAKFKFSEIKSSYSEKTQQENTNNIGVIGCIIIAEKSESKETDWENFKKEFDKKVKDLEEKQKDWDRDNTKYIPYPVPTPHPWIYPYYPDYWDYYRPRRYWISYDSTPSYGGAGYGITNTYICNTTISTNSLNDYKLGDSGGSSWGSSSSADSSLSSNASHYANGVNGFSVANTMPTNAMGAAECPSVFSSQTLDSSMGEIQDSGLGTGFGKKTEVKNATLEHTFDIGEIVKSFVIHYDSRKNLEKIGIVFENKKQVTKQDANPFPASKIKFCEIPEDWKD